MWLVCTDVITEYRQGCKCKIYVHKFSLLSACACVATDLCLLFCRGYPAGQVCRSCAAGCASCGRNATHCLTCEEPLLLHKHQCVEECPPAHTVRDRECQRCPSACHECSPLGQCTGTETQNKSGQILLLKLIQCNLQCSLSLSVVLFGRHYFIFSHFRHSFRDKNVVVLAHHFDLNRNTVSIG